MTQRLEVHRVQGHRVGLVEVELGEYVEELAPLVSRCLELFELPLLFAFFGEGDRVTLIARGILEGFDLGDALAELAGGGGHATAASARLRDTTLLEAREKLLAFLPRALPPAARARDLMIAPFHVLPAGTSVEEAKAGDASLELNIAQLERLNNRSKRVDFWAQTIVFSGVKIEVQRLCPVEML
jgi:tRNA nucleotidyltransferase (CCA-adding enzyme)